VKVLLLGARGYLGEQFLRLFPDALTPHVDIADRGAIATILDVEKPDIVINAAGKTGRPNVDWCEEHKEETIHSNVLGPLVLREECATRAIYWVHMSSGCVYEGDKGGAGFSEDDAPNFSGSFYSRSKAWSDQILSEVTDAKGGILILRIRMPFDGSRADRNLIMKLAKYPRVLDAENSLTYLPDFLSAAKVLIAKRAKGVFNIVNPGVVSPFVIMQRYRAIVDSAHTFERLSIAQLSEVARAGRSNCVLDTTKLKNAGVTLRPIAEAVDDALRQIAAAR
jgi:dTDP-4-dehydrorhamnose reductase